MSKRENQRKNDETLYWVQLGGAHLYQINTVIANYPAKTQSEVRMKNYIIRAISEQAGMGMYDILDTQDAYQAKVRELKFDNLGNEKYPPTPQAAFSREEDKFYQNLNKLVKDPDEDGKAQITLKRKHIRLIQEALEANERGWYGKTAFLVEEIFDAFLEENLEEYEEEPDTDKPPVT